MMISDKETIRIISSVIERDEKCGYTSGGTEHLSYISYNIEDFQTTMLPNQNLLLSYFYTISIEGEFTIYPHNPPQQYHYKKNITLDNNNEIIEESEKEYWVKEPGWTEIQQEIINYLVMVLDRIEWDYGSNRAPFRFPPEFKEVHKGERTQHICLLTTDLGADDEVIKIASYNPRDILEKLKSILKERFGISYPYPANPDLEPM